MVNRNLVKVIAVKQKGVGTVILDLQLGHERGSYDVSIVDRNGIFGLELPDALGLKLRAFEPAQSRNLIASLKRQLATNLIPA